ncbi:YwqJ-related putative deaminase [Streptomyces sp. NBC_01498]|uniref:YwqJ-related putative deaminase n=1 Tax=Streptomyces sp. NBC_01498 TaxID=2975870 RepID=UPI002E7AB445|nr:YwqJ-related putative deaminase [Streptomyces sp. NBC_01498]WTL26325.1 YwqJ-related putative deaminase [Streptomyces sp. NBC_01498]
MSDLVPGVAASLLVHGRIFSHTSLGGDEQPDLHPAVLEFFDELPVEQRESFIGYCAESALVSDQLWALDRLRADGGTTTLDEAATHLTAAALVAQKIRGHGDPEHGTPAQVCRSCSALLDRLGIDVIDS